MNSESFTYSFTATEIKELVRFIRLHEEVMHNDLERFRVSAEKYVYSLLTLEEVERFLL